MEFENAIYFKDKADWRQWLEKNHADSNDVWIIHYKKHSGVPSVSIAEAGEEALCFGWIDSKMKSIDADKFILKYSPRRPKSAWSKINRERAEKMITLGKMTFAGLAAIEIAKKNGNWEAAYTNTAGNEMPSDLKEALEASPSASSNFESFANGYRHTYIRWVNSAKTAETRRKRIAEVVSYSLLNKKPGIE
jgi:uncharacterized protein YdeI (YjbR/CyaY-like superfamily)